MDLLAGIALYENFAMYEHEATHRDEEKRRMYRSISVQQHRHSQVSLPFNTDEDQIHDLMKSLLDQIDRELNPSTIPDTCMLFDASSTLQRRLSKPPLSDKNFGDQTFLPLPVDDNSFQLSNESLQPLDDYKHSIGILMDPTNDEKENRDKTFHQIPSQITYVFDWTRFKRAVKVKKGYHLENCVPLDSVNKRSDEIDQLLQKQQQTVFEPHPIEFPYYLRLKTSMHVHDIPSLHAKQYKKATEKTHDNVYGKKQLEYEYWFSVPKDKSDHLYSFFLRWTPERAIEPTLDDIENSSSSIAQPSNKGFVLLANDDSELIDDHSPRKTCTKTTKEQPKQEHYLKQESRLLKEWEIISIDEIYRRFNVTHTKSAHLYDNGIPSPKLLQPSTLINEEQSKQILLELPARVHALDWYMIFSTETHGFSLNQLYRRSLEVDRDLPSLIIIKDVEQNVFGAFVPHQLLISEGFYGTGESFLFTFYPEFRVFNWSQANEFFVKGDLHSLGFGIGEGTYGLWIDGDLYHGRSSSSKTYENDPLTSNEDFIIASVEVWTFID